MATSETETFPKRTYDIILFGATGYTGSLVAAYLAKSKAPISWAIAGRNKKKLLRVKAELMRSYPLLTNLDLLEADASDLNSLLRLASLTRVICSTVGPYQTYGLPLVEACAKEGTHYCDITGEVPFIRESIDRFDDVAKKTNACIVHSCGFDSVPSDLGVFLMASHAQKNYGKSVDKVTFVCTESKGGFSGGTIASMFELFERAGKDDALKVLLKNPYSLCSKEQNERLISFRKQQEEDSTRVLFEPRLQTWVGPFLMADINTRVVYRSNELLGQLYGPFFDYDEYLSVGPGLRGKMMAQVLNSAPGALEALSKFQVSKKMLQRILPKPGEGPSEKARENGLFTIKLFAEIKKDAGEHEASEPRKLTLTISANGDPGYKETAKMLSEAALFLAQNSVLSGVLTPALALGEAYVSKLREAGMTWELLDEASR